MQILCFIQNLKITILELTTYNSGKISNTQFWSFSPVWVNETLIHNSLLRRMRRRRRGRRRRERKKGKGRKKGKHYYIQILAQQGCKYWAKSNVWDLKPALNCNSKINHTDKLILLFNIILGVLSLAWQRITKLNVKFSGTVLMNNDN